MWERLGIEPTDDKKIIKKAYARQLKKTSPEDDPEGFQELRNAYEAALKYHFWSPDTKRTSPLKPETNDFASQSNDTEHVSHQKTDTPDLESHSNDIFGTEQQVIVIPNLDGLNDDDKRANFLSSLKSVSFDMSSIVETELANILATSTETGLNIEKLSFTAIAEIDSYFSWSEDSNRLARLIKDQSDLPNLQNFLSFYLSQRNIHFEEYIALCLNKKIKHSVQINWNQAISRAKNLDGHNRDKISLHILKLFLEYFFLIRLALNGLWR